MLGIQYTTIDSIAKTIRLRNLRNVIIETGDENAFYPEENRFVLKKDNCYIAYHFLAECKSLESVDFTNFDFSEITSMYEWFYGCSNLKEIILPKNVVCTNLWDLRRCFKDNAISKIDFSSWIFEHPIDLEEFVVDCHLLKTIKLPEMKVNDAVRVVVGCKNLTTINAPIKATRNAPVRHFLLNCESLKVLDVSKAKLDSVKTNQEVLLSDNNLYNIPDNCVILI